MGELARKVQVHWTRVALVWALLSIYLLIRSVPALAIRDFPDPDDVLRLVQVRDLLAGQGWFDLHQYRVNAPEGLLMHWSRLVDLPLATAILVLDPIFGRTAAEQIAIVAIPLLTLAAILAAIAKAASYHLQRETVTLACLCAGLSPMLLIQVQPMRIDHHGWQIFTVVLALVGVAQGRRWQGAALAGAALAAGLSISLEILPLAAGFGAVYAVHWLEDRRQRYQLVVFLVALATGLIMLFGATRGLADLVEHCDAVSPGHLGLFTLTAAGVALVARRNPAHGPFVIAALSAVGLGAVGFYLWQAPMCAAGPFADLEPQVRLLWYENIAEGQPIWLARPIVAIPIALHALIVLAILLWARHRSGGDQRQWWQDYLILAIVSFGAGILVWRSMAFVGALSAIPLGLFAAHLLAKVRTANHVRRKLALVAALCIGLVPGLPFVAYAAVLPESSALRQGTAEPRMGVKCNLDKAIPALGHLPRAKIFAPLDIGPALLERSHHSVVATGHHRGQANMRDVIAAFTGSPDRAQALIARHNAKYLLTCDKLGEMQLYAGYAPDGLSAQIISGTVPHWLEEVNIAAPPAVKLWRVKPE